jgi:putative drug exporter of the RND superfamily
VLAVVAASAVIAALAAPAAGLELGQPDDRNLTTDTTQRQAYDRLAEGFGAGVNGPLVVAASLPGGAPATRWTGSRSGYPPTRRSSTSASRRSTRLATRP